MNLTRKKLLMIALPIAIMLIIAIFFGKCIIFRTLLLIIYILSLGSWIGKSKLSKKFPSYIDKFSTGIFSVILLEMLLNATSYYSFGITKLTTTITLLLPLLLFFLKPAKPADKKPKQKIKSKEWVLIAITVVLDLALLAMMYFSRTDELLPTPWWALGQNFFLLYLATTATLLVTVGKVKNITAKILLTSLHLFITWSVVPMIYSLGFGFDGFIHRATEVWIQTNGFITPKQPFYIGQYSLVVWLSNLTGISIFFIDTFLVSILASLTLPATVILSLKNAWKIKTSRAAQIFWIIPFVYFLSLYLTTPNNLVYLLMMILVFGTLSFIHDKTPAWFLGLLALAAVATHPLVGAPIFIFTALIILLKYKSYVLSLKTSSFLTFTFYFLIITLLAPALFTAYLILGGHPLPNFINPFSALPKFFELFARPYWYKPQAPLIWQLVYVWERMIAIILLLLAGAGWIMKKKRKIYWLYPLSFFAFVVSAWFLRSWVIFPNVADFEQGNYPMRLVWTSIIFLFPWAMYGLNKHVSFITFHVSRFKIKKILLSLLLISLAGVLTVSLYLSYPQINTKVFFPGFNVTKHDFNAVEWIHEDNEKYDYVVLSNSLVAVTAMTEYSFAKDFKTPEGKLFYYSIPSGGPMYKLYQQMVYEGQKREYMESAMDLVGVEKSYFVINDYWGDFENIVSSAQKSADSWQIIDDGKVWVFTYLK